MGKKANKRKQKQQNQRGYSTTNSAPSGKSKSVSAAATVSSKSAEAPTKAKSFSKFKVSNQNHQDLLNLLGALDDEDHVPSSTFENVAETWISPERFHKKIYYIHDTLDQLGVSFENIKKSVEALGYEITLEKSLDWLCLHLQTQDLPPLLTEGHVREREKVEQSSTATSSLIVLKPKVVDSKTSKQQTGQVDFPPVASAAPNNTTQESQSVQDTKEDQQDAAKSWILQQYQYEDNEEGEQDSMNDVTESSSQPQKTQQEPNAEANVVVEESPNERRLAELEQQLKEQETDAYDDASNYMRSKQEVKELHNNVKKLRKQAQGLRKKVEKEKEAARVAAAANTENENEQEDENDNFGGEFFGTTEDEDDEQGGFGGFFDDAPAPAPSPAKDDDNTAKSTQEAPPPSTDPLVPKDSVPSGWTGKTPRQLLEDWCKKEKIRRPQVSAKT